MAQETAHHEVGFGFKNWNESFYQSNYQMWGQRRLRLGHNELHLYQTVPASEDTGSFYRDS
jgi:hypothetical protein